MSATDDIPEADVADLWEHSLGSIEHVIETARVLGFCNEQFTRSYGDFVHSAITAKNELTVSAWSKAATIGKQFTAALVAYDEARVEPSGDTT